MEQLKSVEGLDAHCMQHNCNMKVSHGKFLEFLEGVYMKLNTNKQPKRNAKPIPEKKAIDFYWTWLSKSYTEDNKCISWCPNPQCENVVQKTEYFSGIGAIECNCGSSFCIKCSQFTH